MKFKKIASLMLAMVMAVTALCAMSVNAGAASVFSGAKTMKELNTYTWKTKMDNMSEQYYKLSVSGAGTITFRAAQLDLINVSLYDSKAKEIGNTREADGWTWFAFNVPQKGTYYLKLRSHGYSWDGGKDTIAKGIYYTFERAEKPTITISETLNVGDKINLAASIANYDGKAKWSVSNKKVATIENGVLKAVGEGKCTVTASIDYDTIIDEIKIVVTKSKTPVVMFTMNAKVGDVIDLGAGTANYKGAVTWTSSDKKVATVDNGKITAVSKGSATIKASIDNGGTTTSMMIVVK